MTYILRRRNKNKNIDILTIKKYEINKKYYNYLQILKDEFDCLKRILKNEFTNISVAMRQEIKEYIGYCNRCGCQTRTNNMIVIICPYCKGK